MIIYLVSHQDEIEADNPEEAMIAYVESWRDGWYSTGDCDVKEKKEE